MNTDSIRAQHSFTVFPKKGMSRLAEGQWMVAKYTMINEKGKNAGTVSITGHDLPETEGVTYRFDGQWTDNPKFGKQFLASGFVVAIGQNERETVGYLQSLKGFGKVTAQRVYDVFGEKTFDIIENNWERLSEVKGVSPKKAKAIKDAWDANKDVSGVYQRLKDYGVSPALAGKLLKEFPAVVYDMIEHYPYSLTQVTGFTFSMADALAYDIGYDVDGYSRISAAMRAVLVTNELEGHLGIIPAELLTALEEKLNSGKFPAIDRQALVDTANQVVTDRKTALCTGTQGESEQYIYRAITRETEAAVADSIAAHRCKTEAPANLRQMILQAYAQTGLAPDESQIRAVEMAFKNRLTVIMGGPGTGKTTTMKIIKAVQEMIKPFSNLCFLAPTGKAARRLSESVGEPASTIHSRLKMYGTDDVADDELTANDTIDDDLLIVDEFSMVDIWVARRLLESTMYQTRVILVGDPAQLQSVKAGAVFRDIIASNCVPTATLECIHRQAEGSAIIMNANKISHGDTNLFQGKDFIIHDHMDGEVLFEAMTSQYIRDVDEYGIFQTVCLLGTNALVKEMNTRLQEAINPPSDAKQEIHQGGRILRQDDIVMETKNRENVANGDVGRIMTVDTENRSVVVNYYDRNYIAYTHEDLDRLALAYAMTVHKSQGSEYASVITALTDSSNHTKRRSIPYTAITRAKNICHFFGSYRALQDAILIDDKNLRQTLLAHDIKVKTGEKPLH